jgi:cytochrome c-type biogenesis protein CcmH/NrfG
MLMLPTRPVMIVTVGLILLSTGLSTAQDPASRAESSLEPEFRQLRAKLGALPEFSGADAASKFRLAQELAHRGDMQGAVESYRAAIRLKPDWADPYRGLGQVLLDHHDYAPAVDAFQSSIRLGSEDQQTYYWLGRAYMGAGGLGPAAVALERSLQLKSDDAEAYADLGLVRMAKGDAPGAEQALTRSIQLKPDNAEAHQLRDQLIKVKGDPEQTRQTGRMLLNNLFGRE